MRIVQENKENTIIDISKEEYYVIHNYIIENIKPSDMDKKQKKVFNDFLSLEIEKNLFDEIKILIKENMEYSEPKPNHNILE